MKYQSRWFFLVVSFTLSCSNSASHKDKDMEFSDVEVSDVPYDSSSKDQGNVDISETTDLSKDFTDHISPLVSEMSPEDKSTNIDPKGTEIFARFSENLDVETLNAESVSLSSSGTLVSSTIEYDSEKKRLDILVPSPLALLSDYTILLKPTIRDLASNPLPETSWTFRTRDGKWGDVRAVELNGGSVSGAQIASKGTGDAVAVWAQSDGTSRRDIWANFYSKEGGWGVAERIETQEGTTEAPQVAMGISGDAIAVWEQKKVGSYARIFANRYTKDKGWGEPKLINDPDVGEGYFPQIEMDASGDAIALWTQYNGDVWVNHFQKNKGWGTPEKIEIDEAYRAEDAKLAISPNGDAIAVWTQNTRYTKKIWANRYTKGTGWGVAQLIETKNEIAKYPLVAMDEKGNAFVIWKQEKIIWSNSFTKEKGWGRARRIDSMTGGDSSPSDLVITPQGEVVAVWNKLDNLKYQIWTNRFTDQKWGTPKKLEYGGRNAQITFDISGNGIMTWTQYLNGKSDIWGSRFEKGGEWGEAELMEHEIGNAKEPGVVIIDKSGKGLLIWSQVNQSIYNLQSKTFE